MLLFEEGILRGVFPLKKKWLILTGVVILAVALTTVAFAANPIKLIVNGQEIKPDVPPQIINGRTMVPVRWVAEALGADVWWEKKTQSVLINMPDLALLQQQIVLLRKAIAPTSPEEAVEQWAKGMKERNGALQYAVLSPELKKEQYSNYERCGWITGVSSPWIEEYKILSESKTGDGTWTYEIQFSLKTSTGPAGTFVTKVAVKQYEQNWYVAQILNQDSLISQLREEARDYLVRKYKNHYRILKTEVSTLSQSITDSKAEADFATKVIKVPLYTSPEDWPTQKGRIKYLKENRNRLSPEQIRKVEETIDFWNQELEMYINEPSESNEWLKVTAEFDGLGVINKNSVKIFSDDGLGNYYPVKEDDPSFLTAEELVSQGYEEMQRLVEQQSRR